MTVGRALSTAGREEQLTNCVLCTTRWACHQIIRKLCQFCLHLQTFLSLVNVGGLHDSCWRAPWLCWNVKAAACVA